MKRLIAACVLFSLILFGCIAEYWTVSNTADTLAAAVSGQTDPAILYESYQQWSEKKTTLSAMIAHTEVDQIENLFVRALQASRNQDLNETRLQVAELTGMLRHLSELQFPHLYNIF